MKFSTRSTLLSECFVGYGLFFSGSRSSSPKYISYICGTTHHCTTGPLIKGVSISPGPRWWLPDRSLPPPTVLQPHSSQGGPSLTSMPSGSPLHSGPHGGPCSGCKNLHRLGLALPLPSCVFSVFPYLLACSGRQAGFSGSCFFSIFPVLT